MQKIKTTNILLWFTCTSPSIKHSLILKEIESLQTDISNSIGNPVLIRGAMNLELRKQNKLSNYTKLLQYNGLLHPLTTATRVAIDSATLVDHVFHNHLLDNPECVILDAGLTDGCVSFVKLSTYCKKYHVTGTTYNVSPLIYIENARQAFLERLSKELKMPTSMMIFMSSLKCF